MGNEHSSDGSGGGGGHRRSTSNGTASSSSLNQDAPSSSSSRPTIKRSATLQPSSTITISPPVYSVSDSPPAMRHQANLTPPPSLTTLASLDTSTTSPTHERVSPQQSSSPNHLSSKPKRAQYLSIDYLPNYSSTSPQSHPNSAPSSTLVISPLSSSSSSTSMAESSYGSQLSSSTHSNSSMAVERSTSATSSTSSSPKHGRIVSRNELRRSGGSSVATTSAGSSTRSSGIGIGGSGGHLSYAGKLSPPGSFSTPYSIHSPLSDSSPDCSKPTVETFNVHTHYNSQGQKQINQYVIEGGEIGRGSYGTVKLVFNTQDHHYYAMKVMNKSLLKKRRVMGFSAGLARTASLNGGLVGVTMGPNGKMVQTQTSTTNSTTATATASGAPTATNGAADHWANVQREIAIMKKLSHPNIVRLYEVMDDPSTDHLYLIMEYMSSGSVMSGEIDKLQALPVEKVHKYFRDILRGLEYLHSHGICHRDLKPENLLLASVNRGKGKEEIVKISDFGVSMLFEGNDDRIVSGSSTVGSAAFLAPELCGGGLGSGGEKAGSGSGGIHSQPAPSASSVPSAVSSPQQQNRPTPSLLQAIAAQQAAQQAQAAALGVNMLDLPGRSFSLPIGLAPNPNAPTFGGVGGGHNLHHSSSQASSSNPARQSHHVRTGSDSRLNTTEISGKKGDVWSFGITLYVMLFGTLPFFAKTVALIYRAIVEEDLRIPTADDPKANPNRISAETHPELIDLLHKMLDKNPNTRLSLKEIKSHPWVTQNGKLPMEEQPGSRRTSAATPSSSAAASSNARGSVSMRRRDDAALSRRQTSRGHSRSGSEQLEATAEVVEETLTDTDTEDADGSDLNATSPLPASPTFQPINLTSEEMASAVTLVSRVVLVVKLKARMRKARLQLASVRARSSSLGDSDDGQSSSSSSSTFLARPKLKHQNSMPLDVSADTTCLSPSMSATQHISVPVEAHNYNSHSHHASSSSKRHALFGVGTQALLNAARGAITAGTRGDHAAFQWEQQQHNKPPLSPRHQPRTERLAAPPSPTNNDQRTPLFARRKGSYPHPGGDDDDATAQQTPASSSSAASILPVSPNEQQDSSSSSAARDARHHTAPLRPPPCYYVPLEAYAQAGHSFSCNDVEPDGEAQRAAHTAALELHQQQLLQQQQDGSAYHTPHRYLPATVDSSDDDSDCDLEEEQVETISMELEQDLDI